MKTKQMQEIRKKAKIEMKKCVKENKQIWKKWTKNNERKSWINETTATILFGEYPCNFGAHE